MRAPQAQAAATDEARADGVRGFKAAVPQWRGSRSTKEEGRGDAWCEAVEARLKRLEERLELLGDRGLEELDQRVTNLDAVLTEVIEHSMSARMEELVAMGELLMQKVKEIDADREFVMDFISNPSLQTGATQNSISGAESTEAAAKEGAATCAGVVADAAAAAAAGEEGRRLAAAHRDLEGQFIVLQECLAELGVVDPRALLARRGRKRFDQVCQASGYKPEATAAHLQEEAQVMNCVFDYGGEDTALRLRATSTVFGRDETVRTLTIMRKMRATFAQAAASTADKVDGKKLEEAILVARGMGDEDQVRVGEMLLRRLASARLSDAMTSNAKLQELVEAINWAESTGVDEYEVALARDLLDSLEKSREAARRKLRAATAWTNSGNTEKLQQAIMEAERVGVDDAEVKSSRAVLAELIANPRATATAANGLHEFLQAARPAWVPAELHAVKAKLAKIGIFTTEDMQGALQATGEGHLTERLRTAGLKVFAQGTLQAFEEQIQVEQQLVQQPAQQPAHPPGEVS